MMSAGTTMTMTGSVEGLLHGSCSVYPPGSRHCVVIVVAEDEEETTAAMTRASRAPRCRTANHDPLLLFDAGRGRSRGNSRPGDVSDLFEAGGCRREAKSREYPLRGRHAGDGRPQVLQVGGAPAPLVPRRGSPRWSARAALPVQMRRMRTS
jgi:hypothetical protein